jgi:hypothetical protein
VNFFAEGIPSRIVILSAAKNLLFLADGKDSVNAFET